MISDICFKQIRNEFWLASYGDFEVVINKSNNYINVSHMCVKAKKGFYGWSRNKQSQELVQALIRQEAPDFKHVDSNIRRDAEP